MDPTSFSQLSPGRLVKTDKDAWAFVPNPAPRNLVLDAKNVALLADAEHALGRLGGAAGRLINPWLVGAPLLRREAILSSRIEGTIATPRQLALFESGEEPATPDAHEVRNYVRAMEAGIRQVDAAPVGLWLIRGLHSVLMDGVRGGDEQPGEFRSTQNFIGKPGSAIADARFVPPPPTELSVALADFERFLHEPNEAMPLLARIAVAHYQFEAIHPFRDGNGRVGRLLIVLHLIASKRIPGPLLNFSAWLDRNNDAYRDLLLAVSRDGAFTDWVRFFLEGVAVTAVEGVAQVERLLTLRESWQTRFQSARSTALLMKLVDALFQTPSITIGTAAKLLKVTHAAAAANLRKLEQAGFIVEATGRRRNQIFVAPEILRFLEAGTADNESA